MRGLSACPLLPINYYSGEKAEVLGVQRLPITQNLAIGGDHEGDQPAAMTDQAHLIRPKPSLQRAFSMRGRAEVGQQNLFLWLPQAG